MRNGYSGRKWSMHANDVIVINHKGWRVRFDGWQSWPLRSREDAMRVALGLARATSLRVLIQANDGHLQWINNILNCSDLSTISDGP
jgi:hypothetical protein